MKASDEGTSLTCNGCEVACHELACLTLKHTAVADLTDCSFSESAGGAGIVVEGKGSHLAARKCVVVLNDGCGVMLTGGGSADLFSCELYNNTATGFYCDGTATRGAAENCSVLRNGLHGLHVDAGANLNSTSCLVSLNTSDGVAAEGSASYVAINKCTILDNREGGVTVTGSAMAHIGEEPDKIKNIILV
jgi:hypothetical protein